MSIPNYQDLLLPTLIAFKKKRSFKEAVEFVIKEIKLSKEEQNILISSGTQPLIYNRVGWAKFYLNKAGLLNSEQRGVFEISKDGVELLKTNPDKISVKDLEKYQNFKEFKSNNANNNKEETITLDELTPDEIIEKNIKRWILI